MREVYTRREAIVAGLLGLALLAVVWGPVLLRSLRDAPLTDLRTLSSSADQPPPHTRRPAPPARVAKTGPVNPIDINRADETALQALPGIGPTLAQRIILHRKKHGVYQAVDALMEVEGIGPGRFERLKPWIEVR